MVRSISAAVTVEVVLGVSVRLAMADGAVTTTASTVVPAASSSANAGPAASAAEAASRIARRDTGMEGVPTRDDGRAGSRAGGVDQAWKLGGPWPGGRGGARAGGGRSAAAASGRASAA